MNHKKDPLKYLSDEEVQFVRANMASFEGKITSKWHKFSKSLDDNLGDSDEANLYFLCFYSGACEGALINNEIWLDQLAQKNTNGIQDE